MSQGCLVAFCTVLTQVPVSLAATDHSLWRLQHEVWRFQSADCRSSALRSPSSERACHVLEVCAAASSISLSIEGATPRGPFCLALVTRPSARIDAHTPATATASSSAVASATKC